MLLRFGVSGRAFPGHTQCVAFRQCACFRRLRGVGFGSSAFLCFAKQGGFSLLPLLGGLCQRTLGFGALLYGARGFGLDLDLLLDEFLCFSFFVHALRGGLNGYQADLRAVVGAFNLRGVSSHRFGLVTRFNAAFGILLRSFASSRQACGFDLGLCAFLGCFFDGLFGDRACLCLFKCGSLRFHALLRQAGGFLLGYCAGFCRAFKSFFRQLFFARRTNGINLSLIALPRQPQCPFFFSRGLLQFRHAFAFPIGGQIGGRQGAFVGRTRGRKIKVYQIAQLVGVGIAYRAHFRQHLPERFDDLRIELRAGCPFNHGCRAIDRQRLLVKAGNR